MFPTYLLIPSITADPRREVDNRTPRSARSRAARWRTLLAGFAAGFVALGCGSDGSEPVRAELQARIDQSGRVTPQIALDAFAAVFGPVPGARPSGARLRHPSATRVLDWIDAVREDLRPEQRRAVDRVLAAGLRRARSPDGNATAGRTVFAQAGQQGQEPEDVQPVVDEIAEQLSARTGIPAPAITYDHWVFAEDLAAPGQVGFPDGVAAAAMPADFDGITWRRQMAGPLEQCFISVNWGGPVGRVRDDATLRYVLAHEVAHCFQFAALPAVELRGDIGGWLREGSAVWAGYRVVHSPVPLVNRRFVEWVVQPGDLRAREGEAEYSAVGFFAAMYAAGVDPLTEWRALFNPPAFDRDAAYRNALDLGGDSTPQTWARSVVNDASLGVEWIGVFSDAVNRSGRRRPPAGQIVVGTGSRATHRVPADDATIYELASAGEPVEAITIETQGWGAIGWRTPRAPTTDLADQGATTFCFEAHCACPGGGQPPGVQVLPGDGADFDAEVTLVGGARDGRITVRGREVDELCRPVVAEIGLETLGYFLELPPGKLAPVGPAATRRSAGRPLYWNISDGVACDRFAGQPRSVHRSCLTIFRTLERPGTVQGRPSNGRRDNFAFIRRSWPVSFTGRETIPTFHGRLASELPVRGVKPYAFDATLRAAHLSCEPYRATSYGGYFPDRHELTLTRAATATDRRSGFKVATRIAVRQVTVWSPYSQSATGERMRLDGLRPDAVREVNHRCPPRIVVTRTATLETAPPDRARLERSKPLNPPAGHHE